MVQIPNWPAGRAIPAHHDPSLNEIRRSSRTPLRRGGRWKKTDRPMSRSTPTGGQPPGDILVDDLDAQVAARRTPVHSVFVRLYRRIRIATLSSRERTRIAARG
jgi:hypothetical protein